MTTIRRIRPADYPEVAGLIRRAYAQGGLAAGDPYWTELTDIAARAGQTCILVALHDGLPAGTITLCPADSPYSEIAHNHESELRFLAVDPDYQRQGIGTALIRAAVQQAAHMASTALVLSSTTWMQEAHRLYTRLGFTRTPARDWHPRPDIALITYHRALTTAP